MGMGEPLLNYDAVIESAKIMKDQLSYGLSRKLSDNDRSYFYFLMIEIKGSNRSFVIFYHDPNEISKHDKVETPESLN